MIHLGTDASRRVVAISGFCRTLRENSSQNHLWTPLAAPLPPPPYYGKYAVKKARRMRSRCFTSYLPAHLGAAAKAWREELSPYTHRTRAPRTARNRDAPAWRWFYPSTSLPVTVHTSLHRAAPAFTYVSCLRTAVAVRNAQVKLPPPASSLLYRRWRARDVC